MELGVSNDIRHVALLLGIPLAQIIHLEIFGPSAETVVIRSDDLVEGNEEDTSSQIKLRALNLFQLRHMVA